QRNAATNGSYSDRASSSFPASASSYRRADSAGKTLGNPANQPVAPISSASRATSSAPATTFSPGARSRSSSTRRTSPENSLTATTLSIAAISATSAGSMSTLVSIGL